MSWGFYLGLIAFFTIVLTVFSAVTYSAILRIWDSYDRYYHKEQLQGEVPGRKRHFPISSLGWLIVLAAVIAWLVVEFAIKPEP
jgi:hypothetical protein